MNSNKISCQKFVSLYSLFKFIPYLGVVIQICISDLPWKHQQTNRWRLFSRLWYRHYQAFHTEYRMVLSGKRILPNGLLATTRGTRNTKALQVNFYDKGTKIISQTHTRKIEILHFSDNTSKIKMIHKFVCLEKCTTSI